MLNIMDINIIVFVQIFIATFVINALLFRKLLFNLLDPIWLLVIFNSSTTITLLLYEYFESKTISLITISFIILCQLLFICGAYATKYIILSNQPSINKFGAQNPKANFKYNWERAFIINCLIFISSTLFIIFCIRAVSAQGLSLLSEDPELARVQSSRDGGGLLTRLINPLLYCNLVFWFYAQRIKIQMPRLIKYFSILIPFIITLFTGSKAAFLFFYIAYFNVYCFVAYENNVKFIVRAKYIVSTICIILIFSFATMYIRAASTDATANYASPFEFAFYQLLYRIFMAGSGAQHFFTSDLLNSLDLSIIDYFRSYILIPFFAPFRLIPYEQTLGSILAISMVGDDVFGPNPSMYMEGRVYFGYLGGIAYCFVLGSIFSMFRYSGLIGTGHNLLQLLFFCIGNYLITFMTYDMILTYGEITNFILVIPITLAICLLVTNAVVKPTAKSIQKPLDIV